MSTVVHALAVPLRAVDCPCGYRWLSPPVLDVPDNACPKCTRPASERYAGPTALYDIDIPIGVNAR